MDGWMDGLKQCFFTGCRDKAGRPIIVFRAAKHDPNCDYMETLKLVIYACERAIEASVLHISPSF